ncbi:Hypothetical predicted protein [Octopus vulgaris]|uniref:Uncharacterized protein n=1 Tax=Octopus vulgaris TaxID=6645 RepID=A0AA36F6G7_OCTVU|nr:Hypothetical predicted protein [Octopus vulgaris]
MVHSAVKAAVKRDLARAELQQRVGDRAAVEAGMIMKECFSRSFLRQNFVSVQINDIRIVGSYLLNYLAKRENQCSLLGVDYEQSTGKGESIQESVNQTAHCSSGHRAGVSTKVTNQQSTASKFRKFEMEKIEVIPI